MGMMAGDDGDVITGCHGLLFKSHRIHGAGIYAKIYHIYIPQMLAYIPYMDPMGIWEFVGISPVQSQE
jgi:hypothetical protein